MSTSKKQINDLHHHELYLYFYHDFLSPVRTEKECDYIARYCEMDGPRQMLDLACGHGRHALAFAQRNHRVVGIDMNEPFIALAKAEAARQQVAVDFRIGNILEIDFSNQFDVVTLLFNTLGFFNEGDCRQLFEKISDALKPGGRAFIDTKNRDHITQEIQPHFVTEKDGNLMIDRIRFDPISGTTTNHRTYLKDGVRYDTPFTMHCYHYNDLERIVKGTGLVIEKVLGGWKHEALDSDSRRIVLVLQKS